MQMSPSFGRTKCRLKNLYVTTYDEWGLGIVSPWYILIQVLLNFLILNLDAKQQKIMGSLGYDIYYYFLKGRQESLLKKKKKPRE